MAIIVDYVAYSSILRLCRSFLNFVNVVGFSPSCRSCSFLSIMSVLSIFTNHFTRLRRNFFHEIALTLIYLILLALFCQSNCMLKDHYISKLWLGKSNNLWDCKIKILINKAITIILLASRRIAFPLYDFQRKI